MISTLTNLGTLRFMIFEGALTAVIFLSFLQRLVRDAPRKVFLIVDNLRAHRAKLVTAWVQANSDRIELSYRSGLGNLEDYRLSTSLSGPSATPRDSRLPKPDL